MDEPKPASDNSLSHAKTAPGALRNRDSIMAVLRTWLPPQGFVLEVASGTGEHALWFSKALPGVMWQPSECDPTLLASIAAYRCAEGPGNLLPALELDATTPEHWHVPQADAVVNVNMIHIAPWAAAVGLITGSAKILPPGGVLFLYGPFIERGRETVPSNVAFDQGLRARDPAWGLRDLDDVTSLADRQGLVLTRRQEMPANNLSLLFRKV